MVSGLAVSEMDDSVAITQAQELATFNKVRDGEIAVPGE